MSNFLEIIPEHTTTDLDLNHYECIGSFIDRDGSLKECAIIQDTRIVCKTPDARSSLLKRLSDLSSRIQQTEKEKSSGVLTYMAFSCLDNETGARIYGRYESRDVMEDFLRRKDVLKFWIDSKSDIVSMECRGYLPNGKGWLHRNGDSIESGKAI